MIRRASALGIDVGGTFTDFISPDGRSLKLPSDRRSPGAVLAAGSEALGVDLESGPRIAHGTTVATNALLESKLARTGLLVTRGFRDILALGRQNRPRLYELEPQPAFAPPPRGLIAEVDERVTADGAVLTPLDVEAALVSARKLVERGAETLAICFLNSYRNREHERVLAERLRAEGLAVTSSAELACEFREFERFSTAFANAALMPLMAAYVDDLRARLGPDTRVVMMQSDGGAIGLDQAAAEPVRMVLSGPAGGIVGAWKSASTRNRRQLVTFDMGGTSTDVALLDGGPPVVSSAVMGGRPLLVPVLDIHTVGAGGGSIAHIDSGGLLKVGPQSAGADPGPACYGKDGPAAVTDAHVHLGRIPAGHFLGGEFKLDHAAATRRMEELARKLDLDADEVALGVLAVAEATMERALRTISLERGHDPRLFSLVCFGGAGGLHAASLAARLDMREVVVPPDPGLLSARGMLEAAIRREYAKTVLGLELAELERAPRRYFEELERRGTDEMRAEHLKKSEIMIERSCDLRYRGQSYELGVPLGARGETEARFHELHRKRYGFARDDVEVELVAIRLRVIGPEPAPLKRRARKADGPPAPITEAPVVFEDGAHRTPVFAREHLGAGVEIDGPAIVVEYSSTTVVPPACSLGVEPNGCLLIRRRA